MLSIHDLREIFAPYTSATGFTIRRFLSSIRSNTDKLSCNSNKNKGQLWTRFIQKLNTRYLLLILLI